MANTLLHEARTLGRRAFGLLLRYGMLLLCGRPVYTDTPPCRACAAPQPPGHPARCCECDAALPTIPTVEERQPD